MLFQSAEIIILEFWKKSTPNFEKSEKYLEKLFQNHRFHKHRRKNPAGISGKKASWFLQLQTLLRFVNGQGAVEKCLHGLDVLMQK